MFFWSFSSGGGVIIMNERVGWLKKGGLYPPSRGKTPEEGLWEKSPKLQFTNVDLRETRKMNNFYCFTQRSG